MSVALVDAHYMRRGPGAVKGIEANDSTRHAGSILRLVGITVIAVLLGSGACSGMGQGKPFTRAGVLADLRAHTDNISLPADDPISNVEDHLAIPYVRRTARDGQPRDLLLDVFVPSQPGQHPGVMIVHGGGWKSGDRSMEHPFARQLAARGFVTATVGYRLGPEGKFPNAVLDLKAAVRWLRANAANFRIDPAHIGIVGMSAGGQLAALVGATNGVPAYEDASGDASVGGAPNSSTVGAVVDIDGLADFTGAELVAKETRSPGAPTLFLGGTFIARADVWRAASALFQVGPHSAPTLFVNSTGPAPILPGRTEMHDRLRALGTESDIVIMPGTPHPFWLVNPWFIPTVETTAGFLHRHLHGTAGLRTPPPTPR
jgi:acetyl esterase/lipase